MRVLYVISATLQVVGTLTCLADIIRQDFWNDPGDRPEDIVGKWIPVSYNVLFCTLAHISCADLTNLMHYFKTCVRVTDLL